MWVTFLSDIAIGPRVYGPGDYANERVKNLPHVTSLSWVPGKLTKAQLRKKLKQKKEVAEQLDEAHAKKVELFMADLDEKQAIKEEAARIAGGNQQIEDIIGKANEKVKKAAKEGRK